MFDKTQKQTTPSVDKDGKTSAELDLELQRHYGTRTKKAPTPMRDEAYYGLAGEIVRKAAPHTEACPEAMLVQFLVAFGNMIGRDVLRNQGSWHHTNDFACIVGESSDAKGVSWEVIRELLKEVDPDWLKTCVKQGLATGEALINEIRDEREVLVRGKKNKETGDAETVIEPGVEDKRALVLEQEFSRLLSVSARQGNPMSEVLRTAFDSPPFLSALSKTSPLSASSPHVSVIGHITPAELSRTMKNVDRANGFANRFIWIETYWRHDLPFATVPKWSEETSIINSLKDALNEARAKQRYIKWSKDGATAWAHWYNNRRKHIGELGEILKRDRVHILRLAMIYAILDCRIEMTKAHFDAALAVWEYAEQSARRIFGESTGNKKADQLNWVLQRAGKMTLTEITKAFNNNLNAIERDEIITLLADNGAIKVCSETNDKGKLVTVVRATISGLN